MSGPRRVAPGRALLGQRARHALDRSARWAPRSNAEDGSGGFGYMSVVVVG